MIYSFTMKNASGEAMIKLMEVQEI